MSATSPGYMAQRVSNLTHQKCQACLLWTGAYRVFGYLLCVPCEMSWDGCLTKWVVERREATLANLGQVEAPR